MKPSERPRRFYTCGGVIRPDAPSYIPRVADDELLRGVKAGEFCYVLTSRQLGKTSLMVRTLERLRADGWKVAAVDLTEIGNRGQGQSDDAWYFTLATQIADEFECELNLEKWWDAHLRTTPVYRLMAFFRLLLQTFEKAQIAIFLDEIDCTIHLPFTDDFFACIRACYNRRAQEQQFERLSFTLLGSAIPSDLIQDKTRTPFNIGGRQIILEDFTTQQALPLAKGLPFGDELSEKILARVLFWTNGHPYLTQRMLYEISTLRVEESENEAIDEVAFNVFITPPLQRPERNITDVKRYLASKGKWLGEMKAVYRRIRQGERVSDNPLSPAISYLKLSGLVKLVGGEQLVVRNRLYELAFLDWEPGDVVEKITAARRALKGEAKPQKALHHTTAKIVLVGDSGVGKTGLAWRLAHGEFKEQPSTHGQQFWVVDELSTRRQDGTECEAILWDLGGQPDYRLVHSVFLDDADLALVVFDPNDTRDPLHGVDFWLKQLRSGRGKSGDFQGQCPAILIGARADRGGTRLTREEIDEFCRQRGITGGYLPISAKEGIGLDELVRRIKEQIPWEQKTSTVTTVTFKRIKDYVLGLKAISGQRQVIVTPEEVRQRLEKTDEAWEFTDAEMMTAVRILANYGYVRVLRTSHGEERILLSPELLNNIASSFVLEARRNPKGLGALEERRLLAGEYEFPELKKLSEEERYILLDSAAMLFLEHNVCFRETDPLGGQAYLVFPELINLKKPRLEDEQQTEDGAAYTVGGAVENVYASLVVLLGYTQTFTRTDQWQNQARYDVGDHQICGFRQEAERDGELDLVLYFGTNVDRPVRALFQGLFESFLARRNLSISRYEPVVCPNGHELDSTTVRAALGSGRKFAFCAECGKNLALPRADEPVQLTQAERRDVEAQRWFAEHRSRFEQAIFQLKSYVESQRLARPECFISYAWGDREQERWVERNLATDLQKAGINVVLDRWESARIGTSMARFIERIEKCDRVIVVGTPLYRKKYENRDNSMGLTVPAEVDLISMRLLGTEDEKEAVLPLLLAGDEQTSIPPLLRGRVYADFRKERDYFAAAFDLILSLYKIAPSNPAVADLRESLREEEIQ